MALVSLANTPLGISYQAHHAPPLPRSFGGLVLNYSMSKTQPQFIPPLSRAPSKIYGPPPNRRLLLSEWTADLEVDEDGYTTIGKNSFKCIHCGNWIQAIQELIDDKKVGKKYFVDFQQRRKKKTEDQSDDRLDGFNCDPFEKQFKALEKEFLKHFVLGEDIYEDVKWETNPFVAGAWQVIKEINIGSFCCEDCGNRMNLWHEVRRYQGNDRLKWFSSVEWKGTMEEGLSLGAETVFGRSLVGYAQP